jgi:DNA-binding LacI/PurR family transcriptional regulator
LAGYLVEYFVGPNPPDAVMAASDGPANIVAAALRLFGKVPGRDVLVTGYDNYWKGLSDQAAPAATVDKRNGEIGRALVDLVLARAAGKLTVGQPEHRLVAPRLVSAESTAAS